MKDTRAFLTAGFRSRIQSKPSSKPSNYVITTHSWIECSKGGPWKVTKDPVTGEITKTKI